MTTQAVAVTLPLSGLPDSCPAPNCGEQPANGEWPLFAYNGQLVVVCPRCWQAVIAIDPTFPRTGPVDRWVEDDGPLGGHSEPVSGWERIPDAETIVQAVNYATR